MRAVKQDRLMAERLGVRVVQHDGREAAPARPSPFGERARRYRFPHRLEAADQQAAAVVADIEAAVMVGEGGTLPAMPSTGPVSR